MPSDGVMESYDACRVCGKSVVTKNHFAEKHLDSTGHVCRGSDWHTVRVMDVSRGVGLTTKDMK